ncbi:hypothetical protein A1F94_006786 [Pyrenophora tritici-repentis]|nr:hypothetical protein A1F94_006786 [Pyrenophora tritici-repentis]
MAPSAATKPRKAKPTPKTVADFTILPLTLTALPGLLAHCNDAKHYIYVKPHSPSIPTASDERSLFITNVPMDATESNMRALFQEQLGGSMVERVDFDASVPAQPIHKRWKSSQPAATTEDAEQRGKKRKRNDDAAVIAEGVVEDAESALPQLWNREVRKSGSSAVVVFVDKKSARGALREVQKAVKEGKTVSWKSKGEGLGVEHIKNLAYPFPSQLKRKNRRRNVDVDESRSSHNQASRGCKSDP